MAHERASRWFEQAGYAEEAVQHALTAADYERAAGLVTQYSDSWLNRGEIGKILLWSERLPAAWRHQNPRLVLNYAWALLFRGRENEAELILVHLPPEVADTSINLLILWGNLAAGQGHITQAIALLEKTDAQLQTLESTTPNQTMRGLAVLNLAFITHIQGDGQRAQQNYQAAITLNREVANWFGVMNAMRGWSRTLIEQGRLNEAEAPGYISLFLDEGKPIRRLLEEMVQQKTAPNYAATLLTHFPAAAPPITPQPVSDSLSPREREVLQLIASGVTNQEIADKLVIAPSTAKRHTINIYNKLTVNNRAKASARAYEIRHCVKCGHFVGITKPVSPFDKLLPCLFCCLIYILITALIAVLAALVGLG